MKVQTWLLPSHVRAYPEIRPATGNSPDLWAARGERVSMQVCLRHDSARAEPATVTVQAPRGIAVRVRRVGCVPAPHHTVGVAPSHRDGQLPGFVPDVLFDDPTALAAPEQTTAFWLTIAVARTARPGAVKLTIHIATGHPDASVKKSLTATLQVAPVVLQPRKNFAVTHWFYADAIADWYKTRPFSAAFWPICAQYMRNCAEHGSTTLYVPVFTPPLDGVKRPTQLLGVTRLGKDRYRFDWSQVKRWIATAKKAGIQRFEWAHLFTQWGVKYALRIYHGHGETEKLLWSPTTGATSPTYRKFLAQFLPALKQFLDREKLLPRSFFHVSDEPHGAEHLANYRKARELLRELAPWMQVMDALSEIEFGRQRLTDMPIPSIATALQFKAEAIPSWCYYCCGPTGAFTNRFLDTPLPTVRAQGWLFYRHGFGGFLHWGYNYWYRRQSRQLIDPFQTNDAHAWPGWAHGDTFVVYPGPHGPLDSVRWEIFAESLQDYQLLQTLGIDPDDPRLAAFKTFEQFPRQANAIPALRQALLKSAGRR